MIAGRVAESVAEDLGRLIKAQYPNDPTPRVWIARDHARVYTGYRDEHLRCYRDGRIERSRTNMRYGAQIDALVAEDKVRGD